MMMMMNVVLVLITIMPMVRIDKEGTIIATIEGRYDMDNLTQDSAKCQSCATPQVSKTP